MANAVSSSWGTPGESEARNLSRINRIKQSFQKDYETLHKFIDIMKSSEEMSVDDFDDDLVESHNESIGFLKTAIFQAQNNVLGQIAKRRESNTKTKFTYMKKSGSSSPAENAVGATADGLGSVVNAKACDGSLTRSFSDDGTPKPSSERPETDDGDIHAGESTNQSDEVAKIQPPAVAITPSKILSSLKKIARPATPAPPFVKSTASSVSILKMSRMIDESASPRSAAAPSPAGLSGPNAPSAPSGPPVFGPRAPSHAPRNICSSSVNVFESLSHTAVPNAKGRLTTVPRVKGQSAVPQIPGLAGAGPVDPRLASTPKQQQQLKRPGDKEAGQKIMQLKKGSMSTPSVPKKAKIVEHARSYELGEVVMAKYLKYSYWPAIVVKRPPFSIDSEDCIYIMFWEGKETKMKTSCADVHYTLVRPWRDREAAEALVPKNKRRKDWNDAVDLAEEMVLLTQEERFWKMILIEEKFDLETDYRPEQDTHHDQGFPQKGDVVVVGRDTFYPGIITKEELFFDNLRKDIYYVNGHLHISFMEENTHGWYPMREVWILGKSRGEPWPMPPGAPGQRFRRSMVVARSVLKMPREQRFHQIGAFAAQ